MADKFDDLMARRPKGDYAVAFPRGVKEEFWERGFTKIDRITTDEELAWLRDVYDALFSGEVDLLPGALITDVMSPLDKQRGAKLGQVLRPEIRFPDLKDTIFWRNTERLAKELFREEVEIEGWGHMVRKAPHDDDFVPWHQDEAYWDPSFDMEGAGFWMPLDPATVESGCMSFVPGSHKDRVLRHGFMNGDPSITTLVLEEKIDEAKAVPAPIPIGGVSIHHSRTLHWSGPNKTGKPRRVYVNEWMRTPVKRDVPFDRPWHWVRQEAKVGHFTKEGQAAWNPRAEE